MAQTEKHDLLVIGGGPAGLSAALTAESQSIDTLLLECSGRLGGQAGTASLIENYPGFPEGISGEDLMGRIVDQALKFTTEFIAPARVTEITRTDEGILVGTDDREEFLGTAALLASGVEHRRLKARNLAAYLGRGATYGSPVQSKEYRDKEFFVVGGADSAGQAAVHLSGFEGCNVHLLVRGNGLQNRLSGYLIDKITQRKNIHVHTNTELRGVDGKSHLEKVVVKGPHDVQEMKADEVFVLIGSTPKTSWLPDAIERDRQGFILSGSDLGTEQRASFAEETKGRQPYNHETSMPGLFVAGDVRSGNDKRVTLAILEGASVVPELHRLRIHNQLSNK
jgi:thioredoxin reductase (NADPH)